MAGEEPKHIRMSKPEQVIDNLKVIEVIPKLTPEIMAKIEVIQWIISQPRWWVQPFLHTLMPIAF
jgi:hypothetical protein